MLLELETTSSASSQVRVMLEVLVDSANAPPLKVGAVSSGTKRKEFFTFLNFLL